MYLSRVELPWQAGRNPYDIHRQLWRLFPNAGQETRTCSEDERAGFLFRCERVQPGLPVRLLVQSKNHPQPAAGVIVTAVKEFDPAPTKGQWLRFIITANPTVTTYDAQIERKPGKRSRTCRVPLIHEDRQLAWLQEKLKDVARIESATALQHPPTHFSKGKAPGKLVTVTFDGLLQVVNVEAFVKILRDGLGRGKGFGCGLMLVRRAE